MMEEAVGGLPCALDCVAVSTPTMKMRVLSAATVLPLPRMVTEFKIGESGPVSVTLPAIWMV